MIFFRMLLSWFGLMAYLGFCISPSSPTFGDDTIKVNLPVMVRSGILSDCARSCLSELYLSAVELLSLKDPVKTFKNLCTAYHNASLCVFSQDNCVNIFTFSTVFSGIDELCSKEEKESIKKHEREFISLSELQPHADCLEKMTAKIIQTCDKTCLFSESIIELSENENIRQLARMKKTHELLSWELAPICSSTGCMMACVAKTMNSECGKPSGTIITQSLMKPFFLADSILNELGANARASVQDQLPQDCHYLVDLQQLKGIPIGMPPGEAVSNMKQKVNQQQQPQQQDGGTVRYVKESTNTLKEKNLSRNQETKYSKQQQPLKVISLY
ncbi:hypothetical protein DICVIV_04988 [Dictyocaulus viviparus]|uniref:Chondroitin proteoglycan 4 domain-containing protein n=1 Tax=Dictyocaulus viviparus TaxID=29172 RepID=A0A0D8XYE7_DICVI|nr:hypothetical protein DICVIV_04988 [Dictyocaulus viviparus]